jgi:uncharacterized protein (DUF952 family)
VTGPLYKIATSADWERARAIGHFEGSADDLRDGFIHFSLRHQLETTARKYFHGQQGLWLLAVDPARLGVSLRMEPSRGGDLFPHLYAPLPLSAVLWSAPLPTLGDGFAWPPELFTRFS